MRKFALFIIAFTILIVLLVTMANQAQAQTETPTPTPETSEILEIDGSHVKLDYTVTLGDIAIVICLLFIATPIVIYTQFRLVTTYIK